MSKPNTDFKAVRGSLTPPIVFAGLNASLHQAPSSNADSDRLRLPDY